jgi:glutaminyl-tRNA synthetase
MESPPRKFYRLYPGNEVRLKYAYIVKCDEVVKDASGQVVELRCTADLDSKTGGPNASRKVKGAIHWVSAAHAVEAEVRLYDRLFTVAAPDAEPERDFKAYLNHKSIEVLTGCKLEPSLAEAQPQARYQFERLGYFCLDSADSCSSRRVFNRTISLRDSWAREIQKE